VDAVPAGACASRIRFRRSGGDWELDQVVAVGEPPHMMRICSRHRSAVRDVQWRAAVQRSMGASALQ
jgi:hypothetical protein